MMDAVAISRKEEIRVVLAGNTRNDVEEMIRCMEGKEARVVVLSQDEKIPQNLEKYFADYHFQNNRPTAYVCKGRTCFPPVHRIIELEELLARK